MAVDPGLVPYAGCTASFMVNMGDGEAEVWKRVKNVGDVEVSGLEMNMADVKSRDDDWTPQLPTLGGTPTFGFDIFASSADTTAQLKEDFQSRTWREYGEFSGEMDTEGTIGLVFPAFVKNINWTAQLEDVAKHNVELVYALAFNEDGSRKKPRFIQVGADEPDEPGGEDDDDEGTGGEGTGGEGTGGEGTGG